ncbi:hypothetical protein Tco_0714320 [Tanacetum coccineum]
MECLSGAEAAELKAKGEKNAAYFSLQQLVVETQKLKNENQILQFENVKVKVSLKNAEEDKVETQTKLKDLEEIESLKKDLENAIFYLYYKIVILYELTVPALVSVKDVIIATMARKQKKLGGWGAKKIVNDSEKAVGSGSSRGQKVVTPSQPQAEVAKDSGHWGSKESWKTQPDSLCRYLHVYYHQLKGVQGRALALRRHPNAYLWKVNAFEGQAEALHQLANGLIQRVLALHRQAQALNKKA